MAAQKNPASSYYSDGLLEELCEENRRKLAGDPENISLRCNLAIALNRVGRSDEAIREFNICLEKKPTPEHFNYLGKACLNAGQYDEAIKAFREVMNLGKRWPDTFYHLALAHRGTGQLVQADLILQEAILLNPKYREALNERGEVLEMLNRKDDALIEFKKVIALFFAEFEFHEPEDYKYDLSVLFDNPDLVEETIRRLKKLLLKYPGYADAHYKLGQALEAKGLKNEAMLSFRRALEINPHYETARKSFWKRA